MSPDEKRPIAENEAPKEVEQVPVQAIESASGGEDAPLTKEAFSAEMDRLAERARAAGLNPIRAMAQTYARQGLAIVEGLLVALEHKDTAKKKEK